MTRNQLSTRPVSGSLADTAAKSNTSIAQAFIDAKYIIIVDTSGSMDQSDAVAPRSFGEPVINGPTRYEAACEELAKLQASLPGKIAVMSFSTDVLFCPNGTPTFLNGGTALDKALRFVHIADGLVEKFIVISDGHPNDEAKALAEASKFTSIIDTVYVGPAGGPGADFLKQLAKASGGQAVRSQQASGLAENVQKLLAVG